MYILKGRSRIALRWLLFVGFLVAASVIVMDYSQAITTRSAYILLDVYLISSLLIIFAFLRESDEESVLASPGFLSGSPTRHTLFFYLVYGSTVSYPLAEKRFQSEFIGTFGFLVAFLVMGFPDVLLFVRTKLASGKAIYQRANLFGLWILLLFLLLCVGAAIVAGQ